MHARFHQPGSRIELKAKGWPVVKAGGKQTLGWLVGILDYLADLAETSIYQVVRLAVTLAVVWVLYRSMRLIHPVHTPTFIGIEDQPAYLKSAGLAIFCAVGIAVLWCGPICNALAGLLWQMIDTANYRPLDKDPMDKVVRLVRAGKKRRAIKLCRRLLRRKQVSPSVLETMIARLSD